MFVVGKDTFTAAEVEDMMKEAVNVAVHTTLDMIKQRTVMQSDAVMHARAALVSKGLLPTSSISDLEVPTPQARQAPQEPPQAAEPTNPSGARTPPPPSLPTPTPAVVFPGGIGSLEEWGRTAIMHGETYNGRSYQDVFDNAPPTYINNIAKGIPHASPAYLDFQNYVKARRHQPTPEPMHLPGSKQVRRFVTSDQS